MDEQAKAIRRSLASLSPARRKFNIPEHIRYEVVKYATLKNSEGTSWEKIARSLGLGVTTMKKWSEVYDELSHPVNPKECVSLVPVNVIQPKNNSGETHSTLSIESLNGFRLTGLTINDAITILKALT